MLIRGKSLQVAAHIVKPQQEILANVSGFKFLLGFGKCNLLETKPIIGFFLHQMTKSSLEEDDYIIAIAKTFSFSWEASDRYGFRRVLPGNMARPHAYNIKILNGFGWWRWC